MDEQRLNGVRGSGSGRGPFGTGLIQPHAVLNPPDRAPSTHPDDIAGNDSTVAGRLSSRSGSRRQQQKAKRVACKECRQAKLRCAGLKDGVGPCIRCCRLSLGCQVDTTYKRVNKRLKLNEVVEELEYLRSVVGGWNTGSQPSYPLQPSTTGLQHQSPESLLSPASDVLNSQRGIDDFQSQHEEAINSLAPGLQTWETAPNPPPPLNVQQVSFTTSSPQSLETIELSGSQVDDLFRAFFNHYHPFLEILDPTTTPDTYYEKSPVLFWTIISVAARRYEYDVTLLGSLNQCVTRLIWSTASQPPLPSFTIQALLLLSMWPFPFNTQSKDPSHFMISVARSAAMQNGLHRPETMQDFLRVKTQLKPEEFHAAVKLWAGCYIAAGSVTTCAGQPSLFSNDWAIDRACEVGNNYTVPTNLRYHLLIQKFLARVDKAMSRRTRSPTGQPTQKESDGLIRLLECDFEDLERHIGNDAEAAHRIALAMVSMQLSTYYFFESSASETRKQGLLRAYTTALTFISKLADEDAKNDFVKYAPNVFCLMLNTAGMLIMKIICSSYARYVDIEGGKRSFNVVLGLLRRATLEDNDIRGRGGKIMAQLWTVHHSRTVRREQEPNLTVKSRGGASVLHDGLWTWREEFGGQGGPPSGPSEPVLNLARLPLSTSPASIVQQKIPVARNQELGDENCDRPIQQQQQMVSPNMPIQNPNNMNNLATDLSSFDWIWDVGFPSLLPIDLDSFPLQPPFEGGANIMQ